MASTFSEITWTVRLLEELCVTNLKPVTLYYDHQSTLHNARNPFFHAWIKHRG